MCIYTIGRKVTCTNVLKKGQLYISYIETYHYNLIIIILLYTIIIVGLHLPFSTSFRLYASYENWKHSVDADGKQTTVQFEEINAFSHIFPI